MQHVQSLIKSMTKREKFYFRKLYDSSTTKNFFRLYEYLLSDDSLTLLQVKKNFVRTSISRNIHKELNLLYQKILRVLNIYRMNSSAPGMKILNLLQHIEILIEKKQIGFVPKLLKKARKLAYENEEFSIIIKIISIEEYLFFSEVDSSLVQKISLLNEERKVCVSNIQDYNEQKLLKNQLIDFQFTKGIYTSKAENYPNLLLSPLLEKGQELKVKRTKDLWLFNKGMVYLLTGQYKKSEIHFSLRIEKMKAYNNLFSSQEYVSALNNYLFLMGYLQDEKRFKKMHNALMQYNISYQISSHLVLFISFFTQLAFFTMNYNVDKLKEIISEAMHFVETHPSSLNDTQHDQLYFCLSKALIKLKKYDRALEVANLWNQIATREFSYLRKKTIWFVIHLALGNYKLLSNELSSFRIAYKRKDYFVSSLKLFTKNLKKIVKNPKKKNLHLTSLKMELESEKMKHFLQPVIIQEFDLLGWVQTVSGFTR